MKGKRITEVLICQAIFYKNKGQIQQKIQSLHILYAKKNQTKRKKKQPKNIKECTKQMKQSS